MERISIELTDRCEKGCTFFYARARPGGGRSWRADDVVALVTDCAAHGTRAVSFGGGEPLEYPHLLEVLGATRGRLFRSVTTSGLRLDEALDDLAAARPEKVHVSVHEPADDREVRRAIRQVAALEARGIGAGVNLLVRRSGLAAAAGAARALRGAGIDFPAAHSMDTTWFAVDRDGRVAAFESGEAGAVPAAAYLGEDYPPLEDLPVTGEIIRVAPVSPWEHEYVHQVRGGVKRPAVFHLRDEAALSAEVAAGGAVRIRSEASAAFRVEAPEAGLVDRLHASGACLGCSPAFEEDADAIAATRGLYLYEHVAENWIVGPYRLVAKPSRPATLEALPEDVRDKVVRFDGRFDDTGLLHPMALVPCESWEPAWIDMDGVTVRPIPGHEDEYAEQAADLAAAEPGLVFDPPPAPRPEPEPEPTSGTRRPWWKLW